MSDANLAQALKDLSREWEETSAHWRDVKSLEFQQKYLDDLPDEIARTMGALREIDELLKKIRSDCE